MISPETLPDIKFTKTLNIGVLASGKGTNFEAIINYIAENDINASIPVLIINNHDCGAIQIATKYNIPYEFIDHRSYNTREEHEHKIVNTFQSNDVEIVAMAGWMRIVTPYFIKQYPDRIVNIHPSILPSFKGHNAIKQALDYRVSITGCTAHIVREEIDSGPILYQSSIPINYSDTYETVLSKIQRQEHKIFPMAVLIAAALYRETMDKS